MSFVPASPVRHARPKAPRRRRDAESARAAILDVAERHLVSSGPAGIRLQDVATEAGVSHPTVLHHFGSREALVHAVITRAIAAIHATLLDAIANGPHGESELATLLDGVFEALAMTGHARVLLWLALEGHPIGGPDNRLAEVVDAVHAHRKTKWRNGGRMPARDDTAHTVVLGTLALIGAAVLGDTLLENAGVGHDVTRGARFRAWLARVLKTHLEGA
jgi:AcrR family transcriptional regulator